MDERLKGIHAPDGTLLPETFSEEERAYLSKSLGRKKPKAFDGPVAGAVDFAMEFAATMDKDEIKAVKAAMEVPSAPPEDEEE